MLNLFQKRAVNNRHGVTLCLSVPGSGKTTVLVERFAALVKEKVDPRRIVCTTFTRAAAGTMAERISRLSRIPAKIISYRVCTYHALGRRLLLEEKFLPWWNGAIIKDGTRRGMIERSLPPGILYHDLKREIVSCKRAFIEPEQRVESAIGAFNEALAKGYFIYEQMKKAAKLVDFEDLIFQTGLMLKSRPEIAERQRSKIDHLMVDEFQDTTAAQQEVTFLLAGGCKSAIFVGDPFQSIYGFAGSDCSVINRFGERFPLHETLYLPINYRSTKKIVSLFKEAAPESEGVSAELLRKLETIRPDGVDPEFRIHADERGEASAIADEIKREVGLKFASDSRTTWRDFALLFRTNRLVRASEEAFVERRIPYVIDGCSFYDRQEIKVVLTALRLSLSSRSGIAKHSCAWDCQECRGKEGWTWGVSYLAKQGIPNLRGLGSKACDGVYFLMGWPSDPVEGLTDVKLYPVYHRLASMIYRWRAMSDNCALAVAQVCSDLGLVDWLEEEDEEEGGDTERAENLKEFVASACRFRTVQELISFVEKILFIEKIPPADRNAVTLSTIHKAKGREWSHVYVCGANKDVIPHRAGEPDEEDRILYVALSRAKDTLVLSCHGRPGPFLEKRLEKCRR